LRSFIRHQLVGQVNFVSLEERAKSHEKRTEELSSSE
jgi:hypothetical protein